MQPQYGCMVHSSYSSMRSALSLLERTKKGRDHIKPLLNERHCICNNGGLFADSANIEKEQRTLAMMYRSASNVSNTPACPSKAYEPCKYSSQNSHKHQSNCRQSHNNEYHRHKAMQDTIMKTKSAFLEFTDAMNVIEGTCKELHEQIGEQNEQDTRHYKLYHSKKPFEIRKKLVATAKQQRTQNEIYPLNPVDYRKPSKEISAMNPAIEQHKPAREIDVNLSPGYYTIKRNPPANEEGIRRKTRKRLNVGQHVHFNIN